MENHGISSFVKLLGPSGAFVKLLVLSSGEWWGIQWNALNTEAVAEERMRLLQKMSSNISLTETGLRDNVDGPTASRHTAKASHIH